jgi:predicted RNA binding protein YcfA (HicA-like mRNA interferase family)
VQRLSPVSRDELVKKLRRLGFEGPYPGGKHEYMVRGTLTLRIPNVHRGDISVGLLKRILGQGGISRQEWLEGD